MNETPGLFKYLSPDKLVFFENRLVLLTPPIYLNDPWDFRPKGRAPSEGQIQEVWQELERHIAPSSVIDLPDRSVQREHQELRETIRAVLTSKESLAGHGKDHQIGISKMVGVASLTELPLSRLMWAHYAQSHEGFLAEFAAGEQTEAYGFCIRPCALLWLNLKRSALESAFATQVKYSRSFQQPSTGAEEEWEGNLRKHPDWATEKEWRIICPLQQSIARQVNRPGGGELLKRYFLPFEPRGLRSVVFGMRMEAGVKQRLCDMLGRDEFKHVQKETTAIHPETGELVPKPLESHG